MRLPHGSPHSLTRVLDYRSYTPLLPLFAMLLALVVLLLQGNATAAGGATPGIGVIRWGSSFAQASGYDRYAYVDVTPGDADDAGRLSTNSLVYMSGTSVQTSWSTGVSYNEALSNNWLLKDANGQYLKNTAYGAYVGDIGNPAYQQRFISNVSALLAANGNEGVHIDDVLMTPVLLTGGVFPAKYPTQQSWENAMVSFIQAVGTGLRSRGYYVLAQAVGYIPGDAPGSNDGTTNARFWSRLAPYVSGLLSEYWQQLPNDPTKLRPSGTSSWTRYLGRLARPDRRRPEQRGGLLRLHVRHLVERQHHALRESLVPAQVGRRRRRVRLPDELGGPVEPRVDDGHRPAVRIEVSGRRRLASQLLGRHRHPESEPELEPDLRARRNVHAAGRDSRLLGDARPCERAHPEGPVELDAAAAATAGALDSAGSRRHQLRERPHLDLDDERLGPGREGPVER